jgi:AraC-like DNA-binding protein
LPSEELAAVVAHFWQVSWSLDAPFVAETLPYPSLHIVFERDEDGERARVSGVQTQRFMKRLAGCGWAFGIKLRPGACSGLFSAEASSFSERVVPLGRAVGGRAAGWARAIFAASNMAERITLSERFLSLHVRPLSQEAIASRDLVERVERDRELLRTSQLAALLGVDVRTLQRAFRRHVGVSPKWVVARYRLHEAAERLREPAPPSIAFLAQSLGYSDQAHFARDFRRAVGRTPREFATAERIGGSTGSGRRRR